MKVCRYYLQGNCRFGDRCRYEHSVQTRSYDNRYIDYPRQENFYESDDRQDYNQRRDNYYTQDKYYQNQGFDFSQRYDNYQSSDKYRQNKQYHHQGQQYTPGQNYNSNYNYDNRSRYQWTSDGYKQRTSDSYKQSQEQIQKPQSYARNSNSFSTEESGCFLNENNSPFFNIIKEDILEWEIGKIWTFTCYSPTFNKSSQNFPGFRDISPEEMRLEAYEAKENNSFDTYILSVKKTADSIETQRNDLKTPTPKLLTLIERMSHGQVYDLGESVTDGISLSSFGNTGVESMVADDTLPLTDAASFSFKNQLKKMSGDDIPTVTGDDLYTDITKLSSTDKEQFSASTFKLGKIPTVPPPQILCF